MRPYYVNQPDLQRARQLLDQEKDIFNPRGCYVLVDWMATVSLEKISVNFSEKQNALPLFLLQ